MNLEQGATMRSAQEPSGLVLIVEDNRNISEMVGEYLEGRGFEVDFAADGLDGYRLAAENSYDVIVLDPASLRATRGGTELQLSPIGLKLLTILMRESPRVVSRQEIEREIWGNGLPDSDTLRSHLYNLRKTIDKPFDKPLLHTVQSAGYRIADIEQPPA